MYLLTAYLSGIVSGYYCLIERVTLIVIIITMVLTGVILLLYNKKLCALLLSLITCTFLGNLFVGSSLTPSLPPHHICHYVTGKTVILEGVLYKAPEVFPAKTRYSVQVHKIIEKTMETPVTGRMLLTDHRKPESIRYGDVVRFSSRIRRPKNFNNPGGFDYQQYLALQNIFVTASLDGKHKIVKVGESAVNPFLYRVEEHRIRIREFLTARLSSPAAEIAVALITGEQSSIGAEMRDQYSITGVAHLLAISGLHIGIIALVSFSLVKTLCSCSTWLLLATDISRVSALITLVPVIIYCFIAGGGTATVRATVMVIIYLMAIIINRQDDLWNTLAIAAFLILLYSPLSLFECSFQLSFVSVAAIMYLNPRLSISSFQHPAEGVPPRAAWLTAIVRQAVAVLTVTVAATIGTVPLVAFYFNRCSSWGIPANLLVVPLMGFLVVPLGLLTSSLIYISTPLAMVTADIMEALLNVSNAIVAFIATMPFADYRTVTPTLLELGMYYAGMIMLFNSRRSYGARIGLGVVVAVFFINSGYWYYQNNLNPRLSITSIDVGQGEATLLQFPRGKTMLIDGGGYYNTGFDVGSMVVAPLLWSKKIKRIDILVLSHPHPDHLNGLVFIVRSFSIGEVWTTGERAETDAFKTFEDVLAERGIKKRLIDREHPHRYVHGVIIEFLHPGQEHLNKKIKNYHDHTNNNSLVMKLSFRNITALFTGDIYKAAENEITAFAPHIRSTIVKIPHHGSATSSSKTFLEKLKPSIALLSVGRDNRFGLPHPDVIKRYEAVGCRILRTDRDGAITIKTDGSSLQITTYLEG